MFRQQAVSSVGDLPLPVLSAKPNVSPTGSVHGDLPLPVLSCFTKPMFHQAYVSPSLCFTNRHCPV